MPYFKASIFLFTLFGFFGLSQEDESYFEVFDHSFNNSEYFIQLKDGYLFSHDRGEWGGELGYIRKDSDFDVTSIRLIGIENSHIPEDFVVANNIHVRFIFRVDRRLFALTGVAHMTIDRGSLLEILISEKNCEIRKLVDLGSSPKSFTVVDRNTIEIVTRKKTTRITIPST